MAQPNLHSSVMPDSPVRRIELKPWPAEETLTPLGRELLRLAREIEQSDEQAFDEADIEQELSRRRGGYTPDVQ